MNQKKEWSWQACLCCGCGLIAYLTIHLLFNIDWKSSSLLWSVVNLISDVLFNALVVGIILGIVLSFVIFPLQYYLLKRFNKMIAAIYFVVGFVVGFFASQPLHMQIT